MAVRRNLPSVLDGKRALSKRGSRLWFREPSSGFRVQLPEVISSRRRTFGEEGEPPAQGNPAGPRARDRFLPGAGSERRSCPV